MANVRPLILIDPCYLYRIDEEELSMVVLWVDDVLMVSTNPDYYINYLRKSGIDIKDLGEAASFVSIRITRN